MTHCSDVHVSTKDALSALHDVKLEVQKVSNLWKSPLKARPLHLSSSHLFSSLHGLSLLFCWHVFSWGSSPPPRRLRLPLLRPSFHCRSAAAVCSSQDDEDDHSPSQVHDGSGVLHQPLLGVEHQQRSHADGPDEPRRQKGTEDGSVGHSIKTGSNGNVSMATV